MIPAEQNPANVQEILNNPVQSSEQVIPHIKKEGWMGWLSYIGYATLIGSIGFWVYYIFLLFSLISCLLTVLVIAKSPYLIKPKTRTILVGVFGFIFFILMVLLSLVFDDIRLSALGSCILSLYIFLICWYMHYFYCKSKDGYRHVWLKVFFFTLVPIMLLVYYSVELYNRLFVDTPLAGHMPPPRI